MKIKSFILIMVMLLANNMHAQHTYKKVEEAAEMLRIAMITGDPVVLSDLVHDSLSYGHSSGHIDTKKAFIEKLQSGKSDFVSIDITDQHIQLFDHTALVRHTLSAVTNDNKVPGKVKLFVLQVWQTKKKSWRLIARQAVKAG